MDNQPVGRLQDSSALRFPLFTEGKSRLVVVSTIYHSRPGREPVAVDCRFGRWLQGKSAHRTAELEVAQDPTPACAGWGTSAGMLVVENRAAVFARNPTRQEEAEAESRVVEVAQSGVPFALIRPGESVQFEPLDVGGLTLRCRSGTAEVVVHVFPA